MQIAPSLPANPAHRRSPAEVVFVDRDLAVSLLQNFLTALDTDCAAQRVTFINYARTRAEHQLATWGVTR